jgi:hypothetical protein
LVLKEEEDKMAEKFALWVDVKSAAEREIRLNGNLVYPGKWQATEITIGMVEVYNFDFTMPLVGTLRGWRAVIKPDLPWADDHFEERVSREPLNPAPSYKWWPYYKQDEKWRNEEGGKFSHTYPERLWPPRLKGIRYRYGDLDDVVNLLKKDRYTRQAFVPIWFPEDTGSRDNVRVPCTIGYHLYNRNNKLNLTYPIRSCDYRRHFKNDVYMAGRLVYWILQELRAVDSYWNSIKPGDLTMNIWNLHVFEGEEKLI